MALIAFGVDNAGGAVNSETVSIIILKSYKPIDLKLTSFWRSLPLITSTKVSTVYE